MANLQDIINAKTQNDENWKLQRQAERENVIALRDGGIELVTSDPKVYLDYLRVQGDNPSYSAGNVILAMYQMPGASKLGTRQKWKSMGRYVSNSELNNGAKIFVRPAIDKGRGYNIEDVYDISQTSGKPVGNAKLENGSPQMDKALTTLLNYSPVPVYTDSSISSGAEYREDELRLVVNPDFDDSAAFEGIATAIALARFHDKGQNRYFNAEDSRMDAESVSYILCRRFGIEGKEPDCSNIAELNEGMSLEQRTNMLDRIQSIAKNIGNNIDRQINPQQRKHEYGYAR